MAADGESAWRHADEQQWHGCCHHRDQAAVQGDWRCAGLLLPYGANTLEDHRSADQHCWPPLHASLLGLGPHAEQVSALCTPGLLLSQEASHDFMLAPLDGISWNLTRQGTAEQA